MNNHTLPDGPLVVSVHTGIWPTPSPSVVFVTGSAMGIAAHIPTLLMVRTASGQPTEDIYADIAGSPLPEGLRIERMGGENSAPGHGAFYRYCIRRIGTLAREGHIHAVITRSLGFLPYLLWLRWRHDIPCFYETHDFYGDLSQRPDLPRTLEIRRRHIIETVFLPRLDGVICLSSPQAALLARRYPGLPRVVAPSGLYSIGRNHPPTGTDVCYIGSLDPHKGVGTVLDALRLTTSPDIRLVVIGGKTETECTTFMDIARKAGVADRVRITGWMPHAEVISTLDTCRAGLAPLTETPFNRHLTAPLKLLDYLSRGLPVIATDLPSVREFVTDGRHGILVPSGDPAAFARALDRIVTGNESDRLSAAILADAPRLLWSERGKTILGFIDTVTASGKKPSTGTN